MAKYGQMLALKCQFDKSEPKFKSFWNNNWVTRNEFLGADAVMKSNTSLCVGKFLTNFEAKFDLEQPVIGLCF